MSIGHWKPSVLMGDNFCGNCGETNMYCACSGNPLNACTNCGKRPGMSGVKGCAACAEKEADVKNDNSPVPVEMARLEALDVLKVLVECEDRTTTAIEIAGELGLRDQYVALMRKYTDNDGAWPPGFCMKVVVAHDGWVLMRDASGNAFFGDQPGSRDIADCPAAILLEMEKSS